MAVPDVGRVYSGAGEAGSVTKNTAVLPEGLDFVPSTNMPVNNHFETPVPEDPILSSDLLRHQGTHLVHKHSTYVE